MSYALQYFIHNNTSCLFKQRCMLTERVNPTVRKAHCHNRLFLKESVNLRTLKRLALSLSDSI